MVKSISVALGEPDLYTNALVNVHLPCVVEWDDMSEEGQAEMIDFWSRVEVARRLGKRAFAEGFGCFDAEYDDVRTSWCVKGGTVTHDRGHGLWVLAHMDVVHAGNVKGGTTCVENQLGCFGVEYNQLRVTTRSKKGGESNRDNGTGFCNNNHPKLSKLASSPLGN